MLAMDKKFSPQAMAQVAEIVLVAIAKQLDRKKLRRDLAVLTDRGEGMHEPGVRAVVAALAIVMCQEEDS
jgi:hypothetical protein